MPGRLPISELSRRLQRAGEDVWRVHYDALARREHGDNVILLSVGDPDFPTPPEIAEYLVAQVHKGRTHYSPAGGEPELLRAIAALETDVEGRTFSAAQFTIFPGATAALYCVFACLLDPGDDIVIPEPMYIGYRDIFDALGATIIPVPLDVGDDFSLNISLIESAITDRTKAVLVNTPGNPAGNVMSQSTLQALASCCAARHIWLVCDEVYSLFTYDAKHVSLLKAATALDNVIVIDSLSKSHAMSGWRIGWSFSPDSLTPTLHSYCGSVFFGCSQFIQDAAAFALSFNGPHIENMRSEYHKRRDYVVGRVARLSRLRCFTPQAGMFVMLDVSGCATSGDEFARRLLDEQDVSVIPGGGFGTNTRDYVRVGLTQPVDVLAEALDRIEAMLGPA